VSDWQPVTDWQCLVLMAIAFFAGWQGAARRYTDKYVTRLHSLIDVTERLVDKSATRQIREIAAGKEPTP
jgi:hypothetical protein